MGEMADLQEQQDYDLVHLPETHRRNGWGKYTYVDENDVKHYFKTMEDANKWARKKRFRLSTERK